MTTITQMTRTGKWKSTTVGLTLCVVTKCHLKVKSDCSSCSVAKSCLTLCDPMNCSTSGFPVQAMQIVLSKGGTQPTSSESGLGTRDPAEEGQLSAAWQQHLLEPRLDAAVWTGSLLRLRN